MTSAFRWQDRAACATYPRSLFFPDRGGDVSRAKRICGLCPVRDACLAHALAFDEEAGVWGGLTVTERNRLPETAA